MQLALQALHVARDVRHGHVPARQQAAGEVHAAARVAADELRVLVEGAAEHCI